MSSTESLDPQIRGDSLPILLPTESALGKRNFRSNDNDFDQHFLQLGGPRKRLNTRDGIDDVRYDHNFSGNDHDAEEAEEAGLSLLLAASLLQQNEMTSIVEEILDSTIRDARPCGGGNTTSMRQNQPLFFHSLPATNGNKDAIYPSHSLNTTKNKSADSFLTAITGTVTNDLVFISSDSDSVTANVHTATLTRPMPSDGMCYLFQNC